MEQDEMLQTDFQDIDCLDINSHIISKTLVIQINELNLTI